jgi:hypothetical protein
VVEKYVARASVATYLTTFESLLVSRQGRDRLGRDGVSRLIDVLSRTGSQSLGVWRQTCARREGCPRRWDGDQEILLQKS